MVPAQIAKFMGPAWGPPGSCRPQMGPILAPGTLLSWQVCLDAVRYQALIIVVNYIRDESFMCYSLVLEVTVAII